MPLIEGFGDEVTIFAVFSLLTLLVLSIYYLSCSFTNVPVNLWRSGLEEVQDPSESTDENNGRDTTSHENCNLQQSRGDAFAEDQIEREMQSDGDTLNNNEKSVEVQTLKDNSTETQATGRTSAEAEGPKDDNPIESDQSLSNTVNPATRLPEDSNIISQRSAANKPNDRVEARNLNTSENLTAHLNQITIRIKYLNDTERTINTHSNEKILDFKRKNFAEELSANQTVRLIFNGQLLRNEVSLQYYGICDGCVVHVHISQNETRPPQSSIDSNIDLDLSHLLWPLFSVIIVIFWVLYFNYPEFFSITSTGILVMLTGAFILLYSHGSLQNQQL